MSQNLVAIDQGTTSSRTIVFDRRGRSLATSQREFPQIYPKPGEVEHDPEAIWESQLGTAKEAIAQTGGAGNVAAIGITNQRETTVIWDRATGKPVANAIVWQSRVTTPICERLKADGLEPVFREKTGLVVDPYFSGTKVTHLLNTIPGLRSRAERGEVLFGTIDSFLTWRLTGGKVHATDTTNASRTLMFDIRTLDWDDELLKLLGVPRAMLGHGRPNVRGMHVLLQDVVRKRAEILQQRNVRVKLKQVVP
jgi:glycerol kinase